MKYFCAIVYMVCCVFVAKAQEKQPLIYGVSPNGLHEFDYTDKIVRKTNAKFNDDFGNSTFDPFNGRYFYFSLCHWQKCPVYSNATILEINVQTSEVIYHPIKYDLSQFHYSPDYDPITNSIIFISQDTVKRFFLENNRIENIRKLPLRNYNNSAGLHKSAYNWQKQEIVFQAVIENDTDPNKDTIAYYILNLKDGNSNLLFATKRHEPIDIITWNSFNNKYYCNIDEVICEIVDEGKLDTLISGTGRGTVFWQGAILACYGNKLIVDPTGYTLREVDLISKNSIKTYNDWYGRYREVHTFNQPYIQSSENTYTSTYGKSYRWLWNNQPIENSNTQTYTPTQCGDYKVEVTHLDGRVDTSEAVHYEVKDSEGNLITNTFATAFPNPFRTNLNVQYKICLDNEVIFKVYDLQGKLAYTHKTAKIPAGEHAFEWHSQAQNLRYGLYIVQVFSGDDLISTQKVVKL